MSNTKRVVINNDSLFDMYTALKMIKSIAIDPNNRGMKSVRQQCVLMDSIFKLTDRVLAKAEGELNG